MLSSCLLELLDLQRAQRWLSYLYLSVCLERAGGSMDSVGHTNKLVIGNITWNNIAVFVNQFIPAWSCSGRGGGGA